MTDVTENLLEETCLEWFDELDWGIVYGPDIAPETPHAERTKWDDTILLERLRSALHDINPEVPACGIEDAIRKITSTASPDFVVNNRAFHRFLTEGIDVEISADAAYGGLRTVKVWLLDLEDIDNNNWLALNQFTVVENGVDEH